MRKFEYFEKMEGVEGGVVCCDCLVLHRYFCLHLLVGVSVVYYVTLHMELISLLMSLF